MNPKHTRAGANLRLPGLTFLLILSTLLCATGATAQETATHSADDGPTAPAKDTAPSSPDVSEVSAQPRPVALLSASFPTTSQPVAKTERTPLPAYVATAQSLQLEQRVFTLINEARAKSGLKPLVWDEDAAKLARAHVTNMAQSGFLNHVDPQGRDATARASELGVCGWRALGENIAYNQGFDQPADFAVERWLKSFGHRENVVNSLFTHAAVGVARSLDGRWFFTQTFLAR